MSHHTGAESRTFPAHTRVLMVIVAWRMDVLIIREIVATLRLRSWEGSGTRTRTAAIAETTGSTG